MSSYHVQVYLGVPNGTNTHHILMPASSSRAREGIISAGRRSGWGHAQGGALVALPTINLMTTSAVSVVVAFTAVVIMPVPKLTGTLEADRNTT